MATDFPILGNFDVQRFKQFDPADNANWYLVANPLGKKKLAMYPVMGRRHISVLNQNKLIFPDEPRGMFKSINYAYIVVDKSIYRVDKFFNAVDISQGLVTTLGGDIFFSFLVTPSKTFACFVDGQHIYIYDESTDQFFVVTDPNAPQHPKFIATFGNRIVVSENNSSQFSLSTIDLLNNVGVFDPATSFSPAGQAVFAQEAGIIRQMGVLHNTLYIFTDYTTGIWSNNPSVFTSFDGTPTTFPWRKNTGYDWDYGMADPKSMSIGFSMIAWIAQNADGLIQAMYSNGQTPQRISSRAVDILFQRQFRQGIIGNLSPFLSGKADGFLYQWENTIFYRISAGPYHDYGVLDVDIDAHSVEYNFESDEWHRVIEKNGERNRIQQHVYFNNTHLVSVLDDNTVYEMSGQFYDNEITNSLQPDPQESDAYIREPFRYERVTPIIAKDDYSEFITDFVEIDFVWGENSAVYSVGPFANAKFIIAEDPGVDGEPQYIVAEDQVENNDVYMISEEGNTPTLNENIYNNIFKPHIELYWSDDGGVSFYPAGNLEFSQLGVYLWRMRWYQLGPSRNRVYKLIAVSNSPIVILGGIMEVRDCSDGAA